MESLLKQLKTANSILKQAELCYLSASEIRKRAKSLKPVAKGKWIIRGFAITCAFATVIVLLTMVLGDLISMNVLSWIMKIAGPIAYIVGGVFGVKGYNSEKKKRSEQVESYMKEAMEEEMKGNKILSENSVLLEFLPYEYRYSMATEYLTNIVSSNRASTLTEALNMYDLYYHRWKIENANSAMLENQKRQTQYLQKMQKTNEENARANSANATANMINAAINFMNHQ